jgi:GNAT superfamily N-acetyltransferase
MRGFFQMRENQGLGTAIIKHLLRQASQQNMPASLQVLEVNPARQLYERLGFRAIGETATRCSMSTAPVATSPPPNVSW